MLGRTLICLRRIALCLALAIALVATGFAHRMPAPDDAALAFALANGVDPADFCGGEPGKAHTDPHCLACQIVGSADLPPPQGLRIDLELAFVASVVAPQQSRAAARVLDPAHSPQGPPLA